jgi:16S rRNA (guanine(966)-N(2))-methyltransferase RsmD
MRVISGELGGRRFTPPGNMPHTRPTTDIAKEGLFNIIENNLDLESLSTLDLFGGTGSISYELYSRGVRNLTIVEKDAEMFNFIKKTSSDFGIEGLQVVRSDVFKYIISCKDQFDLIFAGPPYALGNIEDLPKLVFQQGLLKKNGWFILEHTPRNDFKTSPFYRTERKYGTTIFSIFINSSDQSKHNDQS